jgi:hypothetical protein
MPTSDWICEHPYYKGRHHRGHRRCVRARRRIEAAKRQANVAPQKTIGDRQGVDTTRAPGRTRGSLVPKVPSPASLQRKGQTGKPVRAKKR